MKKLSLIAVCLFLSVLAFAQEVEGPRFTVRLGAGLPGSGAEKFVTGLYTGHYGIQGIYDDYYSDTKAIPAITAEGLYRVNEWLNCGAQFIYGSYENQCFDGITNQLKNERKGQTYIVMPEAQVSYYQKGLLSLYMGVAVGAGYYAGFDNLDEKLSFEVQFVPLGVSFGGRVFCFAEGCLGTAVNWVHGGVGFKF